MTRKGARKRSDGIFYRAWDDTWYSSVTGKKKPLYDLQGRRIKGRNNETAARRAYARLLIRLDEESGQAPREEPDAGDILADYIAHLQERKKTTGVSVGYIRAVRMAAKAFLDFVGPATRARDLAPSHLEQFLAAQHEKWKQNTIRSAGTAITSAFYYAVKKTRRLDKNPLVGASKPPSVYRTSILTQEEMEQIRNNATPSLWNLCWFLARTGCRPGEAMRLRVKHVHEVDGKLKFVLSAEEHKAGRKTNRPRHIFLAAEVEAFVRERLARVGNDPEAPILTTSYGKAWRHSKGRNMFYRLRKKLGLRKELSLYSFRHTFATSYLAAGVPPAKVALWLGNTLGIMEKAYWHPLETEQETLTQELDAVPLRVMPKDQTKKRTFPSSP